MRETLASIRLDSANLPVSKDSVGDVGVAALARVAGRNTDGRVLHTVSFERYTRIGDEAVLALAGGLGATLEASLAGCEGLSDLACCLCDAIGHSLVVHTGPRGARRRAAGSGV